MKRKKVMTVTTLVFTCATIASCGKTTETVNAESVVQATEQIVLETETEESTQVSADQGEGEDIALEPTMVDGVEVWPDFPEKYIKFENLNPEKTMYCIDATDAYSNPNGTEGKLMVGGNFSIGDEAVFDATCEIDGTKYYRTKANKHNIHVIAPADAFSETKPSDEDTAKQDTSNSGNSPYADGEEVGDGLIWQDADNGGFDVNDLPEVQSGDWSDVSDEILDQAERIKY